MVMNKYILGDTIIPMLKKEMNLVDYPLPEELRVREGEHPTFGKVFETASRYKADKTKRVAFTRLDFGGAFVGSVAMIFGGDEYDFPYVIETLCFVPGEGGKDKIFAEFDAMPLVKDEESTRKYVDPLRGWREAIDKIPSEPVSGLGKPGEFILDSVSQSKSCASFLLITLTRCLIYQNSFGKLPWIFGARQSRLRIFRGWRR